MGPGLNRDDQQALLVSSGKRREPETVKTVCDCERFLAGRLSFEPESYSISAGARLRVYIITVRLTPNLLAATRCLCKNHWPLVDNLNTCPPFIAKSSVRVA